jgi:uncharacterized OsmC-like protein
MVSAPVRRTGSFYRYLRACARKRPGTTTSVVDGPVHNGCPGEEITPGELFLAAVGPCGVELVQVLAKSEGVPLRGIAVDIRGAIDRSRPVRSDVSLFNSVSLSFRMNGVTEQQVRLLVESFKGR